MEMKSLIRRLLYKLLGSREGNRSSGGVVFTNKLPEFESYSIGDYTYGVPSVLFPNDKATLKIGKFCSIAKNVTIFLGGNHRPDWISTYPFFEIFDDLKPVKKTIGHPSTKGDVIIGNDVWIGRNATILSGVNIGNGAVVAAEAVVTKSIAPYEIWAGNPAKLIKRRFDDNIVSSLEALKWWDWETEKIKKNADLLCSANINLIHQLDVE